MIVIDGQTNPATLSKEKAFALLYACDPGYEGLLEKDFPGDFEFTLTEEDTDGMVNYYHKNLETGNEAYLEVTGTEGKDLDIAINCVRPGETLRQA